MTNIVPAANNAPQLYRKMQAAIVRCHSIDDCKGISDQAAAIAAYYKQIKDDASVRKFKEIKLRAWRRIGEILASSVTNDCETVSAYVRKIQKVLVTEMTDAQVYQALKIFAVPAAFFEEHAGYNHSIASLAAAYNHELWSQSPESKRTETYKPQPQPTAEQQAKKAERARRLNENIQEVFDRQNEAMKEVGITLSRLDREKMRQVVFLIKKEIHETLRQAAFDRRMTMQAILREGLAMWFAANGYDVHIERADIQPTQPSA